MLWALDSTEPGHAWTLTKKGFQLVRERLPELKEEGFQSETPKHDLVATALHLGDWLCGSPDEFELFSEQQLRRFHPELYPVWVPKTELHRPNGYSRIFVAGRMFTVAFEVELHQKKAIAYKLLANFYEEHQEIFRVVWLVPNRSLLAPYNPNLKRWSVKTTVSMTSLHSLISEHTVGRQPSFLDTRRESRSHICWKVAKDAQRLL